MTSPARQLQPSPERYSVEEYLDWERLADSRSEYYDGKIVMMAGGCPTHSLIAMNVGSELRSGSRGEGCRTFGSDLKVRSGPTQFVYPDITVVCGELEFHDIRQDVVTNPRLIVEVLSPSTEHYDRHIKWLRYQQLASLTDYLLVWQTLLAVEHFWREAESGWRYTSYQGLDAELNIPALNCRIPLRQIYDGVEFPETE